MSKNSTMRLVIVALLLALEIILGTFFTVNFAGIAKIGFGFLPIAMIAVLYGPLWAGSAYAIGDVLSWFIKPEGPYFPGLTLTCLLAGLVMGLFLYKKEITVPRCANALNASVLNPVPLIPNRLNSTCRWPELETGTYSVSP